MLFALVITVAVLTHFLTQYKHLVWISIAFVLQLLAGIYCIVKTAKTIGAVSQSLKYQTGIAAGVLQAIGTALPDMAIGILAAILSVREASGDYYRSIQYGMVAGSTTLGSNIYNILFASWCVWRQDKSDRVKREVLMFPLIKKWGRLTPLSQQELKPTLREISSSLTLLLILSAITALVAISVVFSGIIESSPELFQQDIYKFDKGMALFILMACLFLIYEFRKAQSSSNVKEKTNLEDTGNSVIRNWFFLLVATFILFISAYMVIEAITRISELTNIPIEVLGMATALVGCLGEMTVIYDFSIHQSGTIIDAITGVTMDNFFTIVGTCLIALIGGIYLGSSTAIIIFICIMLANTVLIVQTAKLKDEYLAFNE